MNLDKEAMLKRFTPQQQKTVNEIWDLCEQTGKIIDRPTKVVLGLTKAWSIAKLRERLLLAEKYGPMEWWVQRKRDKERESTP